MTPKEQLLQEIEDLSEPLTIKLLDFLQFLKAKQAVAETKGTCPVQSPPTPLPSAGGTSENRWEHRLPPIQAIYTDGACAGNPGPGGWGTVLYLADGSVHEMGGRDRQTTNNRMEMQAAIAGLRVLLASSQTTPVELFTDSEYVRKGITEWVPSWKRRGWMTAAKKPVLNQDLWQTLDTLNQAAAQQLGTPVRWTYVRGHAGNAGNERCDEIARAFSQKRAITLKQHPNMLALESSLQEATLQ